MLEIVITHYNEPFEVGRKLLQSIAEQRCVNFNDLRVTIVNDGGQELPAEKLAGLPFPAEQVNIPHGGISAARNAGIDHAMEEWIMFCDFDDCFPSIYSLREYMHVLRNDKYNMLWAKILAEDYVYGREALYYVPDKQRFVFCHGKVYRTEFLKESGIRFDESLVFNEDSCFNAIIIAKTPHSRIGEIRSNVPLYAWIRRPSSVTNSGREDEASYGHFRRNLIVTGEYEGTGDDRYYGMVTRTAYDAYYMVHGKRNSRQMRRRIADEFTEWIVPRLESFAREDKVDAETLDEIRRISRMELIEPGDDFPDGHEDVAKWLETIADIYSKAR